MYNVAIILVFLCLVFAACQESEPGVFYSTSFESDNDFKEWKINSDVRFKDAAPGFGSQSLLIGGGCVQPAASFELPKMKTGMYRLVFWAKMVEGHSAGINVQKNRNEPECNVSISGDDWKEYTSESFFIDKESPMINIYCGGIVLAEVAIDGFRIEKTKWGETQDEDRRLLDKKRKAILALIKSAGCADQLNYQIAGLSSKPCGGFWRFIVYFSEMDTIKLLTMIQEYNDDEEKYNIRWGIVSDCSYLLPPDSAGCINGESAGFRGGTPISN